MHATMPWKGNRIALAAFTARSFRGIDHVYDDG